MSLLIPGSVLVGLAGGYFAGLFGVGGGMLVVPALLLLLHLDGLMPFFAWQVAVSSSIVAAVVIDVLVAALYCRHHVVPWRALRHLLPGILFGLWCGSVFSPLVVGGIPEACLGSLVMAIGLRLLWESLKGEDSENAAAAHATPPLMGGAIAALSPEATTGERGKPCAESPALPVVATPPTTSPPVSGLSFGDEQGVPMNGYRLAVLGFGSGLFGGLAGVGGTILLFPALLLVAGLPVRQGVATTAVATALFSVAGAVGVVDAGWHQEVLPTEALGIILPRMVLALVVGAVATVAFGVRHGATLVRCQFLRGFGIVLLAGGVGIIWR
ncbi:MAG: sulfite exporter TauE/SafE family protein [Magnetococcales bacterium]|nr:sulfite exporter TauE/SafE family protein [Magnetococcales bacterium]